MQQNDIATPSEQLLLLKGRRHSSLGGRRLPTWGARLLTTVMMMMMMMMMMTPLACSSSSVLQQPVGEEVAPLGVKLPVMIDGRTMDVHFSFDNPSNVTDTTVLAMASSFCDQYIGPDMPSCIDDVASELVVRAGLVGALSTVGLVEKVSRKLVSEGRGDMAVSILEETLGGPMVVEEGWGGSGASSMRLLLKELLGAAYYQSESLEAARGVYEELAEAAQREGRQEDLVAMIVNLGVVMLDQGHLPEALGLFQRAIELSGRQSEDALYHQGKILAYQGDHEGAIAAYQELVRLSPSRGDGYREIGLSLIDLGRLDEAQAFLEAALANDPSDLGALHRLQYVQQAMGTKHHTIEFVTFASDASHCGLRRLLRSASHHGMALSVLGVASGQGAWENGSSKLRLLRDYLKTRPGGQLVCALDGYDVIVTGTPKDILQRYRRFPTPVVFSADTVFFSRHSNATAYARQYPPSPTLYRFLNSGSLIGPAGDLLALIEAGLERYADGWDGWCDQTIFLMMLVDQYHLRAPARLPAITVDVFQDLFGNTGGRAFSGDFDIIGGRLHNRLTDSFPLVLHSPGLAHFQGVFRHLRDQGLQTDVLTC